MTECCTGASRTNRRATSGPPRRSRVPARTAQPGIGERERPRLMPHVVEGGDRPIERIAQERHHERPPRKTIDEHIRHVSMNESELRDVGQLLRTRPAPVAPEKRENVRRSKPAREQFAERSARGLGDVEEEERAVAECVHVASGKGLGAVGRARLGVGAGLS